MIEYKLREESIVKNLTQKSKGFTLIEIIITIAILAVLSTIIIPAFSGYIEKANIATDMANLRLLNSVSQIYRLDSDPIPDELFLGLTSDVARMEALVSGGYLGAPITPKQEDQFFTWAVEVQQWTLSHVRIPTVLTGVTMRSSNGILRGSYSGSEYDMVMPLTLNDITITEIHTRVFQNKGLTSVYFDPDSKITRLYSYAFADNNLTEVVIPASINRLDRFAFANNPLKKITIGSGVDVRFNDTFPNNFKTVYDIGGKAAGTYLLVDGKWVLQK